MGNSSLRSTHICSHWKRLIRMRGILLLQILQWGLTGNYFSRKSYSTKKFSYKKSPLRWEIFTETPLGIEHQKYTRLAYSRIFSAIQQAYVCNGVNFKNIYRNCPRTFNNRKDTNLLQYIPLLVAWLSIFWSS